jgi:hypothetical protein
MLVNSGGDVDLGVGNQWNGEGVGEDSIKPGSIFPVPLVCGEVGVFAEGWLDYRVVWVVVELDDVSPVIIGQVGDSRKLLGVVVEITKYENGVLAERSGIFDDIIHSVDVLGSFLSNRVGCGKTVKIYKGDVLFAISWVKVDVLESPVVVKGRDGIIECGRVWL